MTLEKRTINAYKCVNEYETVGTGRNQRRTIKSSNWEEVTVELPMEYFSESGALNQLGINYMQANKMMVIPNGIHLLG